MPSKTPVCRHGPLQIYITADHKGLQACGLYGFRHDIYSKMPARKGSDSQTDTIYRDAVSKMDICQDFA